MLAGLDLPRPLRELREAEGVTPSAAARGG